MNGLCEFSSCLFFRQLRLIARVSSTRKPAPRSGSPCYIYLTPRSCMTTYSLDHACLAQRSCFSLAFVGRVFDMQLFLHVFTVS